MRQQTYEDLKEVFPNFDDQYVMEVSIRDIFYDAYSTNVRKDGAVVKNIPKMAEAYRQKSDEITPPSVRKLANGKVELKDGVTRVEGAKKAGKETIRVSTYHDTEQSYTMDEWYDWQCAQNDHPIQQANSVNDIQHQITNRVNNGAFERELGFKYIGSEKQFLQEAAAYMSRVYKNSGLSTSKLKNMVKKALSGEISNSYKGYTKDTAMETFDSANKLGCSWPTPSANSIKVDSNGYSIYPCSRVDQIVTNALGNACKKKMSSPEIKIVIAYYLADLAGKDDKAISDSRKKAREEFEKCKANVMVHGKPVFDEFVILPQIKTGTNKENLHRFV